MPWKEVSAMSLRKEFVTMALSETIGIRELCRRFAVSPRTGYKWLFRYQAEGLAGLADKPRTPHCSPTRTPSDIEDRIVNIRLQHPAWGGRKIRARLLSQGQVAVPSPSTVTAVLHRHGLIDQVQAAKHKPWQFFEHDLPNQLWQMDFKGHFPLEQGRCHPLTVLDDHSRFALGIECCTNEMIVTTRERLVKIFRRYGLPERMVMDNGMPWGRDMDHPHTLLTVWLMRLGIAVSHGRPYHPQTQGKDERFHRTLKAEVLQGKVFRDIAHCQAAFNTWREVYNFERPHQSLDNATPASRYQISPRPFPESLPDIEYGSEDKVRKVQGEGEFSFKGRLFKISKAFRGLPIALRPTTDDAIWQVFFMSHLIDQIDLSPPFEA